MKNLFYFHFIWLLLTGCHGDETSTVPVPLIESITPITGVAGTTVVINGANLGNSASDNVVKFSGAAAVITGASSTQLQVVVPWNRLPGR